MTYRSAVLAALALAGCSTDRHDYPSLAVRPIEARSLAEPSIAPPEPAVTDPDLDARIAATTKMLGLRGHAFDVADHRAAPLVQAARHDVAGSERWVAAQSALADLDAQRAAVSDAATALEDLAATRAQALQPDYTALETARAEATALLDREAARIRVLQAAIPAG